MPFAPDDLLALVSDVAAYPAFLPWVKASRISRRKGNYFVGEAVIGYKAFRTRFSTQVDIDPDARTITTRLISGPFKKLACRWTFLPSDSGCIVDLHLDFEFSEPFLADLLKSNMDKAVGKLILAFTEEAKRRYAEVQS
jgi:coenzyme Q-binding protein COQ10